MTTTDIQAQAKGQIIDNFYNICSDPANIMGLWFFDQDGDSTTITDRSTKGHNAMLSANGSTLSPAYAGLCPYVDLTLGAYFQVADHNDFSFGDGSTDEAFSVISLISPNVQDFGYIVAKFGFEQNREWLFRTSGTNLEVNMWDESTGGAITKSSAYTYNNDSWIVAAFTYSGGIVIYQNGDILTTNSSNSADYTAMENTSGNVGSFGSTSQTDAKYGVISIIREWLPSTKIKQISQTLLAYANSLD